MKMFPIQSKQPLKTTSTVRCVSVPRLDSRPLTTNFVLFDSQWSTETAQALELLGRLIPGVHPSCWPGRHGCSGSMCAGEGAQPKKALRRAFPVTASLPRLLSSPALMSSNIHKLPQDPALDLQCQLNILLADYLAMHEGRRNACHCQ